MEHHGMKNISRSLTKPDPVSLGRSQMKKKKTYKALKVLGAAAATIHPSQYRKTDRRTDRQTVVILPLFKKKKGAKSCLTGMEMDV